MNIISTVILAVLGLVHCGEAIRGGSSTSLAYNPHLVSISINGDFACAGSLLTLDWVVTVASCVQDIASDRIHVRAGSRSTDHLGQERQLSQILVYPMFNWYTQDYDLALLKVNQTFTRSPLVHPIELAKDPISTGQKVTVVGWGEDDSGQTGSLKKLDAAILKNDTCKDYYRYDIISPRMICTWVDSKSSPCWDDFGNPLKNRWGRLVGMYTWSRECKDYPSVYTYLHPYVDWIASAIPDLLKK